MDDLFGSKAWRPFLLASRPYEEKLQLLVRLYRSRLHKWFRYVLPLPFRPKKGQTYHLFMCSNYEAGVEITRRFYSQYTGNPKYSPDNEKAYLRFKALHPERVKWLKGRERPVEWKILWAVIKRYDEGICDIRCDDLREIEDNWQLRMGALNWLDSIGYLKSSKQLTDAWPDPPPLYRIDWPIVREKLGIDPPPLLEPLSPK